MEINGQQAEGGRGISLVKLADKAARVAQVKGADNPAPIEAVRGDECHKSRRGHCTMGDLARGE